MPEKATETVYLLLVFLRVVLEHPGARDNASPDVPMIFRSDAEIWPEEGVEHLGLDVGLHQHGDAIYLHTRYIHLINYRHITMATCLVWFIPSLEVKH